MAILPEPVAAATRTPKIYSVAIPADVELPRNSIGDRQAIFLGYLFLLTGQSPERKTGHYINIHWTKLRQLMGGDYRSRVLSLRDSGVIEINEPYSTGYLGKAAFPKSYRLADKHRTGKAKLHDLKTKPAQKIVAKAYAADDANLGPSGRHYCDRFDSFSLNESEITQSDFWTQWTITRWRQSEEFAKRCKYGRYHSLVSQTSRLIRQYLRANGQRLKTVDVSACQPLLLGLAAALGIHPPTASTLHAQRSPLLSYGARFLDRSRYPADVRHWIELCESRDIYSFFYRAVQAMNGPVWSTIKSKSTGKMVRVDLKLATENSFKRATLIPVFDRIEATLANPLFWIIQRYFPTIAEFILATKASGHEQTACLLQRIESEIMIDRVGAVLIDQYPSEPVQPIHDALLICESFAATAKGIIAEQFSRLGLSPRIKSEPA